MNVEFPNQAANKIRELQKLAQELSGDRIVDLEARVKKLEGELMALKARLGKHG